MSADTATAAAPETGAYTPTVGSLLRAELLRVRSRRFVRWAAAGLLAVMALVAVINFMQSAKPSTAEIATATAACVTGDVAIDPDTGAPFAMTPPGAEDGCTIREAAQYGAFDKRPALRSDLPEEVLGVGLGVAVLGFILGCTFGGADWSQKTMAALLFWEPRRVRVFLAKLAALLISLTVLLFAALVLWLAAKSVIVALHGVGDVSFGSVVDDSLTNIGRSFVLVTSMGGLAYGLAALTRNTGAALGVGFVYFAIIELFINGLLPRLAPFTLTINIGALFTPGGLHEQMGSRMVHVSSLQGGLVLVTYATVVCLIGLELFRRRDVT